MIAKKKTLNVKKRNNSFDSAAVLSKKIIAPVTIGFLDDDFPGGDVAMGRVRVTHDIGVPRLFVVTVQKSNFHGSEIVRG